MRVETCGLVGEHNSTYLEVAICICTLPVTEECLAGELSRSILITSLRQFPNIIKMLHYLTYF